MRKKKNLHVLYMQLPVKLYRCALTHNFIVRTPRETPCTDVYYVRSGGGINEGIQIERSIQTVINQAMTNEITSVMRSR